MKRLFTLFARTFLFGAVLSAAPASFGAVGFTIIPSAVSNTYNGSIALQISGLPTGDTVVVQKFLDLNANGVVDAADWMVQQFQLTDGQASVFHDGTTSVTNFNVPGDDDMIAGQITAMLYPGSDISQIVVGKYFFVLTSPAGHFLPMTNSCTVTNFPFAQGFSGNVVNNGTNVPHAAVILFAPGGGGLNSQGGVVADGSGAYRIQMPPGTYALGAVKSNFVGNLANGTNINLLTLGPGATIATNVPMTNATQSISGKVVDAGNPSLGLPGMLVPVEPSGGGGALAITFTDSKGNFSVGVTPNQWKVSIGGQSLNTYGYLKPQNNTPVDTTTGSASGVTIAFPKATAIFYGTVKDAQNHPLPGVQLFAGDQNGSYEADSVYTDTNGNYVAGALADTWYVSVSSADNPSFANYIFSGGTQNTFSAGQAWHYNFTAIPATNQITGQVQDSNGNPIVGVQVNANATVNNTDYQAQADTDGNGNYSLNVASADWNVSLSCQGGSQSLDNILGNGNYQCPNNGDVTISGGNGVANFTVQLCNGVQITTTNLPAGQVGSMYDTFLMASSCGSSLTWSLNDPLDFPPSLNFNPNSGEIYGTPTTNGTFHFSVQVSDGAGHTANQNLSLTIAGGVLQIITTSLPNGTNGAFYSQVLQASGGQGPYAWSIPGYSANPPANLALAANGVLSGTLATNGGPFFFDAEVKDNAGNTADQTLSLTIASPPSSPLMITSTSLPNGNVGAAYNAQLGATGGQTPYNWSLALGSAGLPPGLSLSPGGLIYGAPATNGLSTFKVRLADAASSVTNRVFSIIVNPQPALSSPFWGANRFQAMLTAAANQNYTLQFSSTLTAWTSLFTTNNPAMNSFLLIDANATNGAGFYRVIVGP